MHRTFFCLRHTQGGLHIKASTPINNVAMKAIVPKIINAITGLLIQPLPNSLFIKYSSVTFPETEVLVTSELKCVT